MTEVSTEQTLGSWLSDAGTGSCFDLECACLTSLLQPSSAPLSSLSRVHQPSPESEGGLCRRHWDCGHLLLVVGMLLSSATHELLREDVPVLVPVITMKYSFDACSC